MYKTTIIGNTVRNEFTTIVNLLNVTTQWNNSKIFGERSQGKKTHLINTQESIFRAKSQDYLAVIGV